MKSIFLLTAFGVNGALAGAATYDYSAQPSSTATKKCALLNVVMDETKSTADETNWMKNSAIPNIAQALYTPTGGSFDHVFVCGSGFGKDTTGAQKSFYRFLGCTTASGSGQVADPSVIDWKNNAKKPEDGWNAMDKAMDNVQAVIDGISILDECQRFDRTLIMLTDMERRTFSQINSPLTLDKLKYDIGCNGYVLNALVKTEIQDPTHNKPQQHWKNFALEIHNSGNTNTVHTWDGGDPSWTTSTQNQWYGNFVSGHLGTPYDYMPLVIDTDGVIWNTVSLQKGLTGNNKAAFLNSFNKHFEEEIIGQLRVGTRTQCISSSGGDPHINTWKQEHFEYHGQCDLVMIKDSDFAAGRGIDVHIRTKIVRHWSYIKNVAIRIGSDILEISGSADAEDPEAHYWMNFEYQGDLETFSGFPVTQSVASAYKRQYKIDLSSQYPNTSIVVKIYKEFVRVSFNGSANAFGKTVGLLGDYKSGQTLARDGATVLDDFLLFGDEWQVLPSEPKLFHEVEEPQFPRHCMHPEDPQGERRRRLAESKISVEQAEKACETLIDALSIKDCVYDILATQDLEMVGAF